MSIKVGYQTYRLRPISEPAAAESGEDGYHHPDEARIGVRAALTPQGQVSTLIHELLHAFHHVYGLQWGDEEEDTILRLEPAITAFFRDNPALVRKMLRAVAGKTRLV